MKINVISDFKTSNLLNYHNKEKFKKISGLLTKYIILLSISFIVMYPVIYMFSMTFRTTDQVFDPTVVWIPKSFTFDNLIKTFEIGGFAEAFKNTLFFTVVCSGLTMLSCSFTGYGFARYNFKFKNILFFCVIFSIIIPPQSIIIPTTVEMRYFDFFGFGKIPELFGGTSVTTNLLDTPLVLILSAFFANGIRAGLFIFIFRQFFLGLPKTLEEAAAIDGCGYIGTFLRIILPSSIPAFIIVFIFSIISYWNDHYYTSMLFLNIQTVSKTIGTIRATLSSAGYVADEVVAIYLQAACVITISVPLFIYIIFQRHFTESISRTGLVG